MGWDLVIFTTLRPFLSNIVSTTSTTFSKTSGFTTSYTKLGISATILARNLTSRFKITFNISALYFGVGATNHCFTIGTTIDSVDVLDIVGGSALIGIGIIEQSTNNFSSGCLTFFTNAVSTYSNNLQNITFFVSSRCGTAPTTQPTVPYTGSLSQLTVEEIF